MGKYMLKIYQGSCIFLAHSYIVYRILKFVMRYEAVEKSSLSYAFNGPISVISKVLYMLPETEIPHLIPRVFRIMFPRVIPHGSPRYVPWNFGKYVNRGNCYAI